MADKVSLYEVEDQEFNINDKIISKKLGRCHHFQQYENPLLCYIENTPKEELVLEHVKDYER
jgi:predicted DNA-binding protein YlxM (UPF0122 family)